MFGNRIQGYRKEEMGYVDVGGQLCGERRNVRERRSESGNGAAVFAEGLSRAVASGLGKVRYLN